MRFFDLKARRMNDTFINLGINANNIINGLHQSSKSFYDFSSTVHNVFNNVNVDMSRMYNNMTTYNTQVNTQLNQLNASLTSVSRNSSATTNNLAAIFARQEQQLNIQQRIFEARAANTSKWAQVVQGSLTRIGQLFIDLGAKIISAGLQASRVYDDMSAKLSVLTGDLESAKAKFWELNALEDKTAIATDKLASAYLTLGNNGLRNTTQQMEKYAAIAQGTNKDITGLVQNISNFVNGRLQSLKEYGITAERNGEKLIMSFRGEKKEIEATSKALEEYLEQLADTSFSGVLEARTGTLSASFERLNNAWGTFTTRIMDGSDGAGQTLKVFVDTGTDLLNDLADAFNSPEYKLFFENLAKDFKTSLETAKGWCSDLSDAMHDFWDASGLAAVTGCDSMMSSLQHFFNYARIGLLSLVKYFAMGWKAISGISTVLWEGVSTAVSEFSLTEGLNAAVAKLGNSVEELEKLQNDFDGTISSYVDDIERNKLKLLGYGDASEWDAYRVWDKQSGKDKEEGVNKKITGTGETHNRKSGGGRSKAQEARDTWTPYYQQIIELDMKSKSDIEKLEWDHAKKLQDYQKVIAENAQVSETEKANALLIINTAYQEERKKIQKEAQDFIRSLDPEEAELMRLEDGYRKKLEQLEQFHEDQLVSEQTFLEKREELRNQFEQEKKDFRKKKDSEKNDFFSKEDLENIKLFQGGMNDLSDAFSNLTEGMSKSSAAYKAMFALQKGFAVASATMNAIVAWTKALSAPDTTSWYQSLANYASAVALTTGIIQQLTSVSMHDKGGKIGSGQWGIVGEYGPELVQGPASITSRRDTADMARTAAFNAGTGDVIVNLYESQEKAGSVESSQDEDSRIINIFVSDIRRGGEMSDVIQNTFNLKRIGA